MIQNKKILDEVDIGILEILQKNCRITIAKIGKKYTTLTFVRRKFGICYHKKVGDKLAKIPGVSNVYVILGNQDLVFLCLSNNREEFLKKFELIYEMQDIERTTTMVVMKTIKEDPRIDLKSYHQCNSTASISHQS